MRELWTELSGHSAVIVNVPHAGTFIPPGIAAQMTPNACVVPDTDWHVEKLYAALQAEFDFTLLCATHSRYVVDLNRDPTGAALYPGASNTEICPSSTFHDAPIYRTPTELTPEIVAARVETYWNPYHARLQAHVSRIHALHGYCVLLDGHSIVSVAPRFFAGKLPDLNLGTADGASCDPAIAGAAFQALQRAEHTSGFSSVHNGRFKGGYITRHYGIPQQGQHALQLEMAQSCYMDENRPETFVPESAVALTVILRDVLRALSSWKPEGAY